VNDPRLRLHKTEAIVLKQMDLGEGDRIVTFYTPGQGKLRAVAKGIRKPKSRLAGHLEPLTRCRVLVHKGRELESVSQSETIESNLPLREDLRLLTSGVYMAELVERFTQEGQ
jgi:DNA repair protein RecO (recombination protein O)